MIIDLDVPHDRPDPAPIRLCVVMGLSLLMLLLVFGTPPGAFDPRTGAASATSAFAQRAGDRDF